MRLRVQIKLAPRSHPNVAKKRADGISAGVRGPLTGIDARGRRYSTVEVPGTSLSWREYHKLGRLGFGLGAAARIMLRALWLNGAN